MKKIILLSSIAFSSLLASAQYFGIGLRGGINLSNVNYSSSSLSGAISQSSNLGYQGAIVSEIGLNKFFSIVPELVLSNQQFKIKEVPSNTDPNEKYDVTYKLNYVNIPLLARLTLRTDLLKIYANTGPQLGFFTNGTVVSTGGSYVSPSSSTINNNDFAWVFGGGVGVKVGAGWLFADARYTVGVSKFNKESLFPGGEVDMKSGVTGLSIGYQFQFGD